MLTYYCVLFIFTGKYPHILVSSPGSPSNSLDSTNHEAEIKFSQTPVGSTIQKWVELHNLAPVRFFFTIKSQMNFMVFFCNCISTAWHVQNNPVHHVYMYI